MKWTEFLRPGTLGGIALAASAVLAGGPNAVAAQDADCRCFDRDGNEIENCSCFRTIEPGSMVWGNVFQPRRSQIGVSITYEQDAEVESRGARIEDVSNGPAREAGLQAGDIVVRVDGHSVLDPLEDRDRERGLDLDQSIPVQRFVALVGALEPGEPVEFEVLRDGRSRTLEITPEPFRGFEIRNGNGSFTLGLGDGASTLYSFRNGEMLEDMRRLERELGERGGIYWRRGDDEDARRDFELRLRDGDWEGLRLGSGSEGAFRLFGGEGGAFAFGGDPCIVRREDRANTIEVMVGWSGCTDGVEFTEMNEGLASYFGTSEGVLVTEVHEGSTLGLEAGDVLLAIDGRSVDDTEQVTRILRTYDLDEEMTLRIRRDNREMEVLGQRRREGSER